MENVTHFVPELVPGFWNRLDGRAIFVANSWDHAFSFSEEQMSWVERFSEGKDLAALIADCEGGVSSRSLQNLWELLYDLSARDLLVRAFEPDALLKKPASKIVSFLNRIQLPTISVPVLPGRILSRQLPIAGPLLAVVVVGLIGLWFLNPITINATQSFQFKKSFALGILFSWLVFGLLGSFSEVFFWLALKFCTGVEEKIKLKVDLLGVRIESSYRVALSFVSRIQATMLFFLLVSGVPFFALVLALLTSDAALRSQIFLSALILTSIRWRPANARCFILPLLPAEKPWGLRKFHPLGLWTVGWSVGVLYLMNEVVVGLGSAMSVQSLPSIADQMASLILSVGLLIALALGLREIYRSLVIFIAPDLGVFLKTFAFRFLRKPWQPEDSTLFRDQLTTLRPLVEISDVGLDTLLSHGKVSSFRRGATLCAEAVTEDGVFLLLQGALSAHKKFLSGNLFVGSLQGPVAVGEIAGLEAMARNSTLTVSSESAVIFEIPQNALMLLRAASDPKDFEKVRQQLEWSSLVAACPAFAEVPRELLDTCFQFGTLKKTQRGEELYGQKPVRPFYLILSGSFTQEDDHVHHLQPGNYCLGAPLPAASTAAPRISSAAIHLTSAEEGLLFELTQEQYLKMAQTSLRFWLNVSALWEQSAEDTIVTSAANVTEKIS